MSSCADIVEKAICDSVREGRTVTLPLLWDLSSLVRAAEDVSETAGILECRGEDDGDTWCVRAPLAWFPSDMGGGTADGEPLPVDVASLAGKTPRERERIIRPLLAEWLSCGDWGLDDGDDDAVSTGCSGRARRNDAYRGYGLDDVEVSIWVRPSTGEWGIE